MALIVEDGTIVSGAEAYVSVSDADTYNNSYVGSATWLAAASTDKEISLRRATQYLDVTYGSSYVGVRVSETQDLLWPREFAEYPDGIIIERTSIPIELKRACMELAIKDIVDDGLIVDVDAPAANVKRSRVKAAVVEEEVEYWGGNTNQKKYVIVERLMRAITYATTTVYRT